MDMSWLKWWGDAAELIYWQVIIVGSLVWLYQGAFALATRTNLRKAAWRATVAGLVCIGIGAMSFWVGRTTSHLIALTVPRVINQVSEDWGLGSPPEEREKNSRILASIAFVDSGHLLKYVDQVGNWKDYCPTTEDASRIAEKIKVQTQLKTLSEDSYSSAIRTWTAGVVAFVLGWVSAISRRKTSANQAVQGTPPQRRP